MKKPEIRPGSWINIGQLQCVVSKLYDEGSEFGDCEVVFNPEKPTNRDVYWDGSAWQLTAANDFGGYAARNDRLKPFVIQLKNCV